MRDSPQHREGASAVTGMVPACRRLPTDSCIPCMSRFSCPTQPRLSVQDETSCDVRLDYGHISDPCHRARHSRFSRLSDVRMVARRTVHSRGLGVFSRLCPTHWPEGRPTAAGRGSIAGLRSRPRPESSSSNDASAPLMRDRASLTPASTTDVRTSLASHLIG